MLQGLFHALTPEKGLLHVIQKDTEIAGRLAFAGLVGLALFYGFGIVALILWAT